MITNFKKKLKAVAGYAEGVTGVYTRNFRSKMVIVAFHRVNDDMAEDGLTIRSAKFAALCRFFRKHFRVVPLSEQVAGARAGRSMGGTLSITFDDGYLDNWQVAAPILRTLGLPATFFITTGFVDTSNIAPWDQGLPRPPRWMSWDQVRSLVAQGFEIGCHTDTHVDMGSAALGVVRAELQVSQRKLQQELGTAARLFAYPFGGREHISERSRDLVREAGLECCASCFGGLNPAVADPYYLKRIGIGEWFATPHQFGFELNRVEV